MPRIVVVILGFVVAILGFVAAAVIGKFYEVFLESWGWYVLGISLGVMACWFIIWVIRWLWFTRRFNQMSLRDLQCGVPSFREHDILGSETIATFGLEAEMWLETLLRRTFGESQDFPTDYTVLVAQYIRYLESLKYFLERVIDWSPATAVDLYRDGETFWFDMRGKSHNYEELVTQLNWLDKISEQHSKFTNDFQTPLSLPSWRMNSLLVARKYSQEQVRSVEPIKNYFGDHEVISLKCKPSKFQHEIDLLARFINSDALESDLSDIGSGA